MAKILPIHPNLRRAYGRYFLCPDSGLVFRAEKLGLENPFGLATRGLRVRYDALEYNPLLVEVDAPLRARAQEISETLHIVRYTAAYALMGLYFEWTQSEQVQFYLFEFRAPDDGPRAYPPFETVQYDLYGMLYDRTHEYGVVRYQAPAVPITPYAAALIRFAADPQGVWSGGEIFQWEDP